MDLMSTLEKKYLVNQENDEKLYNYTYDDWFNELSNLEIAFFSGYIELYENERNKFLERLVNPKEQIKYFQYVYKIARKANVSKKMDEVKNFFKKVPMKRFLKEVHLIAQTFDYVVEKNVAQFIIGNLEGDEPVPFDENVIQQDELCISWKGEKISFSIQSILYFLLVNATLHEMDEKRVIGCKCDNPNELYAYAYANVLLSQKLKSFFIVPEKNYVTSTLYTYIAFSKAIRFLNDILENQEFEENEECIDDIMAQIIGLSIRKEQVLYNCYANFLESKIQKMERIEKQQVNKLNELQKKLDKQKEKCEQEVEKIKKLKQEMNEKNITTVQNQEVEKRLKTEITELKNQLKLAKEELKEEKKKHEKELCCLRKKFDEQLEENKSLICNVSKLQKQLNEEKRQNIPDEELTFEQWLQKGQEFLQEMSFAEEEQLKDFIALAEHIIEERNLSRPPIELATNRIGYCKVDENGHFINFGDHNWKKINSIPTSIYLSNGQFIEVTKDLALVRVFDYYFSEGPGDHAVAHFVVVEERHQEAFAKVDGITTKIQYKDHVYIKDGQVISINQNNEIISYYQNRSITLDDLLPSIRLKGHEPLYVVMALAKGYVVRDLTEIERFIELEEPLLSHSFIILDETGNITYNDPTGQLFKRSSMYKKKLLASVSEMEDQIYVQKTNYEYVQLNDVPKEVKLELGDMIWVDEFNRFIELVEIEEQYISDETIEQKLLDSGHKVTRKTVKPQVVKDKDLLIIGNIRLSERYKKYFGEYGYNVEVVDGTGPFEKIKQACSKYNTIIYSTAFTNHKNSGKMNKEVTKPYIFCDSTAPKVMHYMLEHSS